MATTRRGFASLTPEQRREIASKGGKAAHENGTAHEFNKEEAKNAGKKGGLKVSQNKEHMATIGKKGGAKSRGNRRVQQTEAAVVNPSTPTESSEIVDNPQ